MPERRTRPMARPSKPSAVNKPRRRRAQGVPGQARAKGEAGRKAQPPHARQREPAGRSPTPSAAKAKRSERRGREDYGWGRAGGVTKPNRAGSPATTLKPPIRKGTTRHGSPLLEVRLPHDELARRLAVCAHIRCVHDDRLCLDFEREARWWAYSASPALRDTFRRDAFPVGKPANTPRELLDSLEEL